MSSSPTDAQLEQATDPDELRQLVLDHGDAIYRLAYSIARDRGLAEDISQESLVKAWLALPTLKNPDAIRGWILRITHNTAISVLRSRRAMLTDPHELPEPSIRSDSMVESRVQTRAAMNHFLRALDELDDLSRSVIVLRELEGLSYDEIATMLGVPIPTVKTRLLRSRRKLGTSLKEWA